MRCWTHRETEALGVCRSCGRGLCGDCAGAAPGQLVCGDACRAARTRLHQLLAKEAWRSELTYSLSAVATGSFTLFCLAVVVTEKGPTTRIVFGGLAAMFAALSVLRFVQARRWKGLLKAELRRD